jgi:hypothetical protein
VVHEVIEKAVNPNKQGHKRPEKGGHMGKKQHSVDVTVSKEVNHCEKTANFSWREWIIAVAFGVAMQVAPLP